MSTKLIGILTDIFPVETRPNFSKKVFWLKEFNSERFPQHWEIELHGNDLERLKGFEIGDILEAEVEVRGKKWQKNSHPVEQKIFLSLKCVGLCKIGNL